MPAARGYDRHNNTAMTSSAGAPKTARKLKCQHRNLRRLVALRNHRAAVQARAMQTGGAPVCPGDEAWMIPAAKSCNSTEAIEALIKWNCTPPRAARRLRVIWRDEFVARVGAAALAAVLEDY